MTANSGKVEFLNILNATANTVVSPVNATVHGVQCVAKYITILVARAYEGGASSDKRFCLGVVVWTAGDRVTYLKRKEKKN